jgi:NAD-dependent deacetylase
MSVAISNKLKCLLVPSTNVVVFTGAGVSSDSGVPTFRGKDGLWNEFNVQELATPQAFAATPVRVWEWYRWRMELISKVDPNAGHRVISWMEGFFSEFTLVTQNVDGLHDRAGNRQIFKLHGDLWEVRCVRCKKTSKLASVPSPPLPPICECGGALRPGVVWFGELLPEQEFSRSVAATEHCQLFFSVGTSAEVYPAAQLPMIAKEKGAYVVEINIEPSALADKADEVLIGKAGEVLPLIQQSCTVLL